MRKTERACIGEALKKIDALIAATNGDDSSCVVFSTRPGWGVEPFTEAQKKAIRIYVESWIREPLSAALAGLDGHRGWENERTLEAYGNEAGALYLLQS